MFMKIGREFQYLKGWGWPEYQCFNRQGWNSSVYKNTVGPMFERMGPEY